MNPITKPRDEDEYYDRREKTENELFCYSCGRIVKNTLSVCPSCGRIVNYRAFDERDDLNIVFSILFAIFGLTISIIFIAFTVPPVQVFVLVQLLISFIFLCIVGIVIGIFISYSYVGGWIKNHNKNNKSK